jgi:hypothetical protein
MQLAVQHQAATGEIAHIEVGEVAVLAPRAEQEFSRAGSGRVVAGDDGPVTQRHQFRGEIEVFPGLHHVMGRAGFLLPFPQIERGGNAEPRDAAQKKRPQPPADALEPRFGETEKLFRRREMVGHVHFIAGLAREIDHHQVAGAAAHLEANGKGAVRVE